MLKLRSTTKRQPYLIAAGIAIVLVGIVAVLVRINTTQPSDNTNQHPLVGLYTVAKTPTLRCTLSEPPMCSGDLVLEDEASKRLTGKIGPQTTIHSSTKEAVRLYPSELKEGMPCQVTFEPGTTNIEHIVVSD